MRKRRFRYTMAAIPLAMVWIGIGLAAGHKISGLLFAVWFVIALMAIVATWQVPE